MVIGINCLYLIPGKVGGTETYLRNLIRELMVLDQDNQYILFTNLKCCDTFGRLPDRWREVVCPFDPENKLTRIWWEQVSLPRLVRQNKVDVLHSPAYVSPLWVKAARVVTIHDMHYHYFPETFSKAKQLYWKWGIPVSAKRSEQVLTVSYHAAEDIKKTLYLESEQVKAIPLAASDIFLQDISEQEVQSYLKDKKFTTPYILCVATFNRHKNLTGLIRSFAQFKIKSGLPHHLVLAGILGEDTPRVMAEIVESGCQDVIHVPGPIPFKELPLLYRGAEVFCLLSYFEGFGLPILEAMACGVPVICSNRTSLPEVAGDAAIVVNPDETEQAADAMLKLLTHPDIRQEYIERGKKRITEFSWRKMASETLEAYRDAERIWKKL